MEHPTEIDDFGIPACQETPVLHMFLCEPSQFVCHLRDLMWLWAVHLKEFKDGGSQQAKRQNWFCVHILRKKHRSSLNEFNFPT